MPRDHQTFDIRIVDPYFLNLPDIESPTVYLTAQMEIVVKTDTLYRWSEQDVDAAVEDLQSKTSVGLGAHGYLDVFLAEDGRLDLVIWEDGHARPTHTIELSEADFYAAIDRLEDAVQAIGQRGTLATLVRTRRDPQ